MCNQSFTSLDAAMAHRETFMRVLADCSPHRGTCPLLAAERKVSALIDTKDKRDNVALSLMENPAVDTSALVIVAMGQSLIPAIHARELLGLCATAYGDRDEAVEWWQMAALGNFHECSLAVNLLEIVELIPWLEFRPRVLASVEAGVKDLENRALKAAQPAAR